MLLPGIQKIAVLRANALGDFIFALPALEALRAAYPQAEITLLGRPWHVSFLTDRPGVIDRVIPIPQGGIGSEGTIGQDPAELAAFFAAMQQEQFDLAIQMHGGGRNSNPFLLALKARHTLGLRTPDAIALERWMPYLYYQSEVVRYLELVSQVGAIPVTLEPRLKVTPADLQAAARALPETPQPLVALHPGASDPRRHWPAEKFAAVGDALAAAGMRVVVTGVESEQELVKVVIGHMAAPAENLCGRLSLNGLTGLLSRCAVVLANDTGPLHLATAVGTPTVGIYWCGNLITAGQPLRHHHRPLISWCLDCPVCGASCIHSHCDHRESFVAEVTVEDAIAACRELARI